ncbi:cytokine-like protein 1 [Canis lupus baileyi]|uniref:Cytokine like 1 n=3 Tax=Canis lupus TaxID=9612 RepID=A0A8I3MPM1_CANLF|nr:cytokine-like protein 1 [Canis lupus dingo]XP_038388040.1 cytokine-like protein 1 [Canis lupus familiaris]XP_038516491.1 cytokine-like protein 1 [Canis lupus familiaris]XP_853874.1 cytokine-like protein 1 [Canis lupus familiaris]|eukprot:XP_853874.1 cytokine-like protein 1 [Canis lupus familiaris]
MMPRLLCLLLLLLAGSPTARPAPPTCYSRMLSLSREVTGDFQNLQATEPSEPCVRYLPRLYLDIHNHCVLAKLRDFVASPQCWKVAQVDGLKDKVRKLYTIMNSFCRRDLVFLSDDCNALEYPIPVTTILPDRQR